MPWKSIVVLAFIAGIGAGIIISRDIIGPETVRIEVAKPPDVSPLPQSIRKTVNISDVFKTEGTDELDIAVFEEMRVFRNAYLKKQQEESAASGIPKTVREIDIEFMQKWQEDNGGPEYRKRIEEIKEQMRKKRKEEAARKVIPPEPDPRFSDKGKE